VVEGAESTVTRTEALTLKQALVQFEEDTGYLPWQGPFALVGQSAEAAVPQAHLPSTVLAELTSAEIEAWSRDESNLWPLIQNPFLDDSALPTHPLGSYDPVARRGWNGPYLANDSVGLEPFGAGGVSVLPVVLDPYGRPFRLLDAGLRETARVASSGTDTTFDPLKNGGIDPNSNDVAVLLFR
jgi:hypothetical protein